MWFNSNGVLYNKKLLELKIKHFVTTKTFGDMTKKSNRKNLFSTLNIINSSMLITAEQIHSNKIQVVTVNDIGKRIKGADGLITDVYGIPLGIFTADCVPVFVVAKGKIGLVHIGWRGLKAGIVESAIKKFCSVGTYPRKIFVCFGPHICKNCYEMDLQTEIYTKFKLQGVPSSNIELIDLKNFCTYHNPEMFYSYRRHNRTERMLSFCELDNLHNLKHSFH